MIWLVLLLLWPSIASAEYDYKLGDIFRYNFGFEKEPIGIVVDIEEIRGRKVFTVDPLLYLEQLKEQKENARPR